MFEKETEIISQKLNRLITKEALPGSPERKGAIFEGEGCNISVYAGTADSVDVCITDANGWIMKNWRLMRDENEDGVFCGYIPGMKPGNFYNLLVQKEQDPDNQTANELILLDPYAHAVTNETFPRGIVVDDYFDWENDTKPNVPESEMIIYEGHVKGLTKKMEQIPENIRGTYAGIASDEFIGHLKKLGITSLELMPTQQFMSEPHLRDKGMSNYWGYNTIGFFAPHSEYSSDKRPGEQVREMKDMIKKLHQSGIEVILDVVYNHTAEGSERGSTLSLKGLDEDEYYHLSNKYHCNYTGCGNTINTSSDAGLNLVMDSLKYWTEEMHIDGFRFDLAPSLAREGWDSHVNMNGRFMKALKEFKHAHNVKLIAEPWDMDCYVPYSYEKEFGTWNGMFRDDTRDFYRGNGDIGNFAARLAGSSLAARSINLVTAHDGFTLNDLVSYNWKHNYDNGENNNDGVNDNRSYNFGAEGKTDNIDINQRRRKVARSMILAMMISSGTPMISHGDEMLRTQDGNNNAYCQDNEIAWMNWNLSKDQRKFMEYTSEIANLRKANSVFQKTSNPTGMTVEPITNEKDIAWIRSDGHEFEYNDPAWHKKQILGMYLSGIALRNSVNKSADDHSYLFFTNGTHQDQEIILPTEKPYAGVYELVVDTAEEDSIPKNRIIIDTDKLSLKSLSSVLLRKIASNIQSNY